MTLESYTPRWPETAVFWGAGATASLNMKTTYGLSKAIFALADRSKDLGDRLREAFGEWAYTEYGDHLEDLFLILGDGSDGAKRREAVRRQLGCADGDDTARYLSATYDWVALCSAIETAPHAAESWDPSAERFVALIDLFNLI